MKQNINININKDTKEKLNKEAKLKETNLNNLIETILTKWVNKQKIKTNTKKEEE